MVLDGSDSDWQGVPLTYLEESVRVLGAAHDGTNLLVMFRFADERLARRVSRYGVTLWVDGGGGHSTSYGLRYAGSAAVAEAVASVRGTREESGFRPPPGVSPPEDVAPAPAPGNVEIVRGEEKDLRPEGSPTGPGAASAVTNGLYCYEVRIPIGDIPGLAQSAGEADLRSISLGIQLGGRGGRAPGMRPGGRGGLNGGMGGPGGGMGGRGGGMGGPGGAMGDSRGGHGGSRPDGPAVNELVWVTLELAPISTQPATPSTGKP